MKTNYKAIWFFLPMVVFGVIMPQKSFSLSPKTSIPEPKPPFLLPHEFPTEQLWPQRKKRTKQGTTVRLFRGMNPKALTSTQEKGFSPVPEEAIKQKNEETGYAFHDDLILHQGAHALSGILQHSFVYSHVIPSSKTNPVLVIDLPVETLLEEEVLVLSVDAYEYFLESLFSEKALIEEGLLKAVLLNQKGLFKPKVTNIRGQEFVDETWAFDGLRTGMVHYLLQESELFFELNPDLIDLFKESIRENYQRFHAVLKKSLSQYMFRSFEIAKETYLEYEVLYERLIQNHSPNFYLEDVPVLKEVIFELSEEEYVEYVAQKRAETENPIINSYLTLTFIGYFLNFYPVDWERLQQNPELKSLFAKSLSYFLSGKTREVKQEKPIELSSTSTYFPALDFAKPLLDEIAFSDHPFFSNLRQTFLVYCHQKSETNKEILKKLKESPEKLRRFVSNLQEVIIPAALLNKHQGATHLLKGEFRNYTHFPLFSQSLYSVEFSNLLANAFSALRMYQRLNTFTVRTLKKSTQKIASEYVSIEHSIKGENILLFTLVRHQYLTLEGEMSSIYLPDFFSFFSFINKIEKGREEYLELFFSELPQEILLIWEFLFKHPVIQKDIFIHADLSINWKELEEAFLKEIDSRKKSIGPTVSVSI